MNKILRNFSIKNGFCLLAAALALVTTGCEKDHADAVGSSEEEVLLSSKAQVYPLTIHATKTAWKATCTENWITLSQIEGIGTENIELTVQENTLSASRTATIQLAMNSGANAKIVVRQQGVSDTEIRVSPELITAKPYYTAPKYAFTLEVRNKVADPANDIMMAVNYVGDSKNWIKNFSIVDVPNSSYHLTNIYSFETEDNTMANAREAEIVFTVKYGHNTYTKTVKVYQNGLGTPAVATAENIYMRHNQTSHAQTIWLNDGDRNNVTYQIQTSSSQSGSQGESTTDQDGWITKAEVVGDNLVITAAQNTYNETRQGDVYIIASRGNHGDYAATTKMRIHVTQSAHKDAGIGMPVSEVAHNYTAASYTMPLQLLNGSSATAATIADWITDVKVENGTLSYNLAAYTGGQTGKFREGVITLTASNGNANKATYALTVRQYAPEMPGISMPVSKVSYNSTAASYTLPIQPLEGTTLEAATTAADWIKNVSVANGTLTFDLTAYAGGEQGNSREGVISIKASNDNADKALYYITVCQYAPEMPGISNLPEYIGLGYTAVTNATLEMNPLNGTTIEQAGTPSANWLTASVTGNQLTYSVTANTAAAAINYSREAVITLKASNTNGNAAYYYITVRQYARDMAYLDKTSISMAGYTYNNYTHNAPSPQTITVNNIPQGSNNTISWTSSATTGSLVNANGNYKFGFTAGSFESQIVVSHSYNGLNGYYNTLTNSAALYITVHAYPYKQYFTVPCTMTHTHQTRP